MASPSKTSICNGALLLLGSDGIGSLNDDTDKARACNQAFSSSLDTALQAYPWNFAVRRVTLTQNATAPDFGFAYAYDLPNNPYCLRVLRAHEPRIVFKREGRQLLSDSGTLKIKYIARIESVSEFSALFREALEHFLAWKICYAITGSTSLRESLMGAYEAILADAEDIDTQEGTEDPDEEYMEYNDLIRVRGGGSWRG